jgi:hypothetical protein
MKAWALGLLGLAAMGCGSSEGPAPLGVRVTSVAIYQGPERVLWSADAMPDSVVPLVTGRDALVRAFYETTADYDGGDVRASLQLGDGDPIVVDGPLYATSESNTFASTVNFEVPAARVVDGASFSVEIASSGKEPRDASDARAPRSGEQKLPDVHPGRVLHVVFVPMRYEVDGSGRLPDVSQAQLDRYRAAVYGEYPIADIDLTLHAVVPLTQAINTFAGMQAWVDQIVALRSSEKAAPEEYWIGIGVDSDSVVTTTAAVDGGLSATLDPDDAMHRAAVVLGFTSPASLDVLPHELGHLHGRMHTACGATSGTDPNYPYADSRPGVDGYNVASHAFMPADDTFDLMGYCRPRWISDYNYAAIDEVVQRVSPLAPGQ